MEIRRPCISSSQRCSTVPAFPSVSTTALPTSSARACSNSPRIADARTFTIDMGDPDSEVELVGLLHLKGAQVVTGPRQTRGRWNSARHDRAHDRGQIALYVWIHPDEDRTGSLRIDWQD